jgi:hypothetical protein
MPSKDFIDIVDERFKTRAEVGAALKKWDKLAASKRVTLADIEYALRKHKGVLAPTAEFLGMEYGALKRKVETTPSLSFLRRELEQINVDKAEYEVLEQVDQGVLQAATFYLKAKAKDRGYTEKVDVHATNEIGSTTAAALIEAMRKGIATSKELEESTPINVEDYTVCPEPSVTSSHPDQTS